MYEFLDGNLAEKSPTSLVLDVGGVGYFVNIPVSTYADLPAVGDKLRLLTHFVVREDAQALYGFLTEEERELFRMLISVSGIGPKVALAALSGIPIPQLKQAIVDGALSVLTSMPGIGKKTAERIIVELREKIVVRQGMAAPSSESGVLPSSLLDDCTAALVSLGYKKPSAKSAVEKVLSENKEGEITIEDVIRASLKYV